MSKAGPARGTRSVLTGRLWLKRSVAAALLLVVVVAALAVPTRRYLEQRSEIADRRAQRDEIEQRNAEMSARIERLDDPDEIQRVARREYGLVTPGEESYTILPPATAGLNLPDSWPFDVLAEPVRRVSAGAG